MRQPGIYYELFFTFKMLIVTKCNTNPLFSFRIGKPEVKEVENILICSDDPGFLDEMKLSIQELGADRYNEIMLFSGKDKLEFYISGSSAAAHVLIIDMDQEDDGIGIAECVLGYQKDSQIIFVSESDEYYLDVYSVDHVYFLKKPVENRLLAQALEKAGQKLDRLHVKCLVVKNKQGIYRIELSDIIYFENEKRKIHVHTADRKISFYGKFEELADGLGRGFCRCHNSYIINLTKVCELSGKKFLCENGKSIPISKTYYVKVKDAFEHYV